MTIVIQIGHISSHRCSTYRLHLLFKHFIKSSVLIVDIQIVPFKEVIGNINILPAIAVYIPNGNTKAKSDNTTIYSGFLTDVHKFLAFISK